MVKIQSYPFLGPIHLPTVLEMNPQTVIDESGSISGSYMIHPKKNLMEIMKKIPFSVTDPTNSISIRHSQYIPPKKIDKKTTFSNSGFKISDASDKTNLNILNEGVEERENILSPKKSIIDTRIFDVSKTFKDIWNEPEQSEEPIIKSLPPSNEGPVIDKSQIDCHEKFMAVVKRYGLGFSPEVIMKRINDRLPARIIASLKGNPPCPFLEITYYTRRDLGYDPAIEMQMQSKWAEDSMNNGGLDRASWVVWMLSVRNAQIEEYRPKPSVEGEDYWDYL